MFVCSVGCMLMGAVRPPHVGVVCFHHCLLLCAASVGPLPMNNCPPCPQRPPMLPGGTHAAERPQGERLGGDQLGRRVVHELQLLQARNHTTPSLPQAFSHDSLPELPCRCCRWCTAAASTRPPSFQALGCAIATCRLHIADVHLILQQEAYGQAARPCTLRLGLPFPPLGSTGAALPEAAGPATAGEADPGGRPRQPHRRRLHAGGGAGEAD